MGDCGNFRGYEIRQSDQGVLFTYFTDKTQRYPGFPQPRPSGENMTVGVMGKNGSSALAKGLSLTEAELTYISEKMGNMSDETAILMAQQACELRNLELRIAAAMSKVSPDTSIGLIMRTDKSIGSLVGPNIYVVKDCKNITNVTFAPPDPNECYVTWPVQYQLENKTFSGSVSGGTSRISSSQPIKGCSKQPRIMVEYNSTHVQDLPTATLVKRSWLSNPATPLLLKPFESNPSYTLEEMGVGLDTYYAIASSQAALGMESQAFLKAGLQPPITTAGGVSLTGASSKGNDLITKLFGDGLLGGMMVSLVQISAILSLFFGIVLMIYYFVRWAMTIAGKRAGKRGKEKTKEVSRDEAVDKLVKKGVLSERSRLRSKAGAADEKEALLS